MSPISRGFAGRRRPIADPSRVPPGQYVTGDFPVLSAGPTPHTPLAQWSFKIDGAVDESDLGAAGPAVAACAQVDQLLRGRGADAIDATLRDGVELAIDLGFAMRPFLHDITRYHGFGVHAEQRRRLMAFDGWHRAWVCRPFVDECDGLDLVGGH